MKWLTNSEYYHSVWSAEYKYDGLGLGENRHSNIVTFGNSGTFEIEDELRNKGLGSYMLDSIIVWAKKNYPNAIAEISIGSPYDSQQDKKKLARFYGIRKLKNGVKVEKLVSRLEENNKIERIIYNDFMKKISKKTNDDADEISKYKRENLTLYSSNEKKEKCYRIVIGILSSAVLILGVLLKTKFS
ncbi:hypothetical protein H6G17_01305 [Chroococcidiopsis sp. FACHB-1243]|uniref:hypothetical protein n=1 Tax=Chroococcidiopsis sp. [FACHB-1243] TaxID=2692781 RepID=UPI001780C37E|nr:hypothetical protein [Chroococcidiopsis sp. [FACHB-1243]]MBD2304159.1 hypothetical protein [Chroococcidiopsis sp. [FACHB-1243]]